MQLSPHFKLETLIRSSKADALKIKEQQKPGPLIIENLKTTALKLLEPLYDIFGDKMTITSGWRCSALNRAVGGSLTSQHLVGEAADIQVAGLTPLEVMQKIQAHKIVFDQMIEEYGRWTHVSFSRTPARNRNQVLKARIIKGEPKYFSFKL